MSTRINNFEKGQLIRQMEKTSLPTDKWTSSEHALVRAEFQKELQKTATKHKEDIAAYIKAEKVFEALKEKMKAITLCGLDKNHDLDDDELQVAPTHYIEVQYNRKSEIKEKVIKREKNEQAKFIKRLTLAETREEADKIFSEYQALITARTEDN